jgi:hypothetical protein
MKRHAAGHGSPHSGKRKRPHPSNGRVSQACGMCAKSKLKCDEEKPCRRCREKGLTCDWPLSGNEVSPESPAEGSMGRLPHSMYHVISLTNYRPGLMADDEAQYEPLESTQPQAPYAIPIDQTPASRFSQSSHENTRLNGSLHSYIAEERSNIPSQEPTSVDFNGRIRHATSSCQSVR